LERRISALALSQKPTLELTQEFVETYKQKTAYEKYPLNTVLALSVPGIRIALRGHGISTIILPFKKPAERAAHAVGLSLEASF
jgi:hypothetical protein